MRRPHTRARAERQVALEPRVVNGRREGSQCRPFLRIEKEPNAFAACNALAAEVGTINEPQKALLFIEDAISNEVNEVFGVMMLDLHGRFKGMSETGRGERSSVMAPLHATLQAAIGAGASAVIIYHVHPSGIEAKPSKADKDTTKSFAKACDVVNLPLIDHIIVGGDARNRSYYSFAEDGKL